MITMYFHCARCLAELPAGESPESWARLNVGWTQKGLAVRCVRHDLIVVALDFLGQKIDYDDSVEQTHAPH